MKAADLDVRNLDGKKLSAEEYLKRMASPAHVFVLPAPGEKLDPYYKSVLREDVLLVHSPALAAGPPAFDAPAPAAPPAPALPPAPAVPAPAVPAPAPEP